MYELSDKVIVHQNTGKSKKIPTDGSVDAVNDSPILACFQLLRQFEVSILELTSTTTSAVSTAKKSGKGEDQMSFRLNKCHKLSLELKELHDAQCRQHVGSDNATDASTQQQSYIFDSEVEVVLSNMTERDSNIQRGEQSAIEDIR